MGIMPCLTGTAAPSAEAHDCRRSTAAFAKGTFVVFGATSGQASWDVACPLSGRYPPCRSQSSEQHVSETGTIVNGSVTVYFPSPLAGEGGEGARKARHEPGEGSFVSALRANPSPALALLGHPLPRGEREFGASAKPKLRSVL